MRPSPGFPFVEKGSVVPHIVVEYSANLETHVDMRDLLGVVHAEALETGVFPEGGIRVRAARRDLYIVADGDPANCFVHIMLMIGPGRTAAVKKSACERIFNAVCGHLAETFETVPLAISLTLNELNGELTFRHNNLHERLKAKANPPSA